MAAGRRAAAIDEFAGLCRRAGDRVLQVVGDEIQDASTHDIKDIVDLTPGVTQGSFKGQRGNTVAYYIDGVKVRGELSVPRSSIREIRTITGALPAEYGDVLGGVVVITTKSGLNIY